MHRITKNIETTVFNPITTEMIANCFVAAFEGGCNFWCSSAQLLEAHVPPDHSPWYDNKKVFEQAFKIQITDNDGAITIIQRDVLVEGCKRFCENYPALVRKMVNGEQLEGVEADKFLQLIVYGEIHYRRRPIRQKYV